MAPIVSIRPTTKEPKSKPLALCRHPLKLTFFVILIHLLALIPLFHFVKPIKPKPTHITIRTVELEKSVPLLVAEPAHLFIQPTALPPVVQQEPEILPLIVENKFEARAAIVQEKVEIQSPIVQKEPKKPKPIVKKNSEKIKPVAVAQKKVEIQPPIVQKEPKKPTPIVKKESEKIKPTAVAQKKPATKAKPVQKERSELLALMEESLLGLEKTSSKISKVAAPIKVGKLKSESSAEISYQEKLVDYLQAFLHLPEDGNVGIKLTVTREGVITNIVILKASSARNERYIKDNLKPIILPSFGNNFKGENEHSFSLKLTSN